MKQSGTWKTPPNHQCVHSETFNDTFDLDLYPALQSEGGDNILKGFKLAHKNGLNHAQFAMRIERLVFKENQAEAEMKDKLGTWETGYTEAQLIKEEASKEQIWRAHQALTVFRIVTVVVSFA